MNIYIITMPNEEEYTDDFFITATTSLDVVNKYLNDKSIRYITQAYELIGEKLKFKETIY